MLKRKKSPTETSFVNTAYGGVFPSYLSLPLRGIMDFCSIFASQKTGSVRGRTEHCIMELICSAARKNSVLSLTPPEAPCVCVLLLIRLRYALFHVRKSEHEITVRVL